MLTQTLRSSVRQRRDLLWTALPAARIRFVLVVMVVMMMVVVMVVMMMVVVVVVLTMMRMMLQWCVNGRCESTSKNIGRTDSLQHNSEAGGWSSWSRWGQCSRTCGAGAAFRTRRCNNPRPSYGGAPCRGNSEEFRLCNIFRSVLQSSSPHQASSIK